MKALIIKDYLVAKKSFKNIAFNMLFFLVLGLVSKNFAFLTTASPIMMISLGLASFSYDEYNKSDSYLLSLQLDRRELVLGKYSFIYLLSIFTTVLFGLITLVFRKRFSMTLTEVFIGYYASFCFLVVLISVTLPIVYKSGIAKSRYVLMAFSLFIVAGFGLGGLLIKRLGLGNLDRLIDSIFIGREVLIFLVSLLIIILMGFGSLGLSLKIIEAKDL